MTAALPNYPASKSELIYENGSQFVCPESGHEWSSAEATSALAMPTATR